MNRYVVFVAVVVLQIALVFSGSIDRAGKGIVKRADDLLTNEIDLSVNDIDNAEGQKRLKLVLRQADNETVTTTESSDRSTNNSSFCNMISSFVTLGCNALSSVINNMTKMLQQNCPFLNSGHSASSSSS